MTKQEIVSKIVKANKVYWETGENGLPEAEYNSLMHELGELDSDHPLVNGVSAVKVASIGKVKHATPMLSLDKAYTVDELQKWMVKVARTPDEEFVLTPKYDGIAARLLGALLATRGDGEAGENISHFFDVINFDLDPNNDFPTKDGEILITDETFKIRFASGEITRGSGELYKTPRNAAAGILNNDVVANQWKGALTFVEHSRYSVTVTMTTIWDRVEFVKNQIKELGLPTDGLVLKVKDTKYAASLGATSHHWKHSIALKHANKSVVTRLIDVEFQMAKDHIGMVGILEPVEIGGVMVKRVSLHNLDIIEDLQLKIGDVVTIERAGDVIPHIVSVDLSARDDGEYRDLIRVHLCPSCKNPVRRDNQFYVCDNEDCEDKLVNKIDSALKDLGSKGIASETIRVLVQNHTVQNIGDLLNIKTGSVFRGPLGIMTPGFGDRKIEKILAEIERLRNMEHKPEAVLATLNIPGFGKSIFKKLLKEVDYDQLVGMSVVEVIELPNMAETRAKALIQGLKDQGVLLSKMTELNIKTNETKGENKMRSNGTVCFTGKGDKGRKEYTEMAEDVGMEVASSVTSGLGMLVCADPESDSGKMKKARANGTKVISYQDFERMVA